MRNKVIAPAILLLFGGAAAFASFTPVGDPLEGNSWGQRFELKGSDVDLVAVRMTIPSRSFEIEAERSFTVDNWSVTWEHGGKEVTQSVAEGPGADSNHDIKFNIWFNGDENEPYEFDFVAFHEDSKCEEAHANWDGHEWQVGGQCEEWHPDHRDDTKSIPAPGAALLGAIGLGLTAWAKRRIT